MMLSQHAKNRLILRNKEASFMRKTELQALIDSAVRFDKAVNKDHGFQAEYYLIQSIQLILVLNPKNGVIVTCYGSN